MPAFVRRISSSDQKNKETIKSLLFAATTGDYEQVKLILEKGIDINSADLNSGFTCLHIAAAQGDEALLDILLEHDKKHGDLKLYAVTKYPPRKAWQLAMRHQHFEMASLLDPLNTG